MRSTLSSKLHVSVLSLSQMKDQRCLKFITIWSIYGGNDIDSMMIIYIDALNVSISSTIDEIVELLLRIFVACLLSCTELWRFIYIAFFQYSRNLFSWRVSFRIHQSVIILLHFKFHLAIFITLSFTVLHNSWLYFNYYSIYSFHFFLKTNNSFCYLWNINTDSLYSS